MIEKFKNIFKGLERAHGCTKVGPISDKGVYEVAKSFAERLSKGDVQVKHGSDESKTDSPY